MSDEKLKDAADDGTLESVTAFEVEAMARELLTARDRIKMLNLEISLLRSLAVTSDYHNKLCKSHDSSLREALNTWKDYIGRL